MSRRRFLQVGILSLLAAPVMLAGPAHDADHGPGHFADRAEHHLDRMREMLDLSEAQQQQVRTILEANRVRGQAYHQEMRAQHERLDALLASGSADAAEVGELVIDLHRRKVDMQQRRQQVHGEIDALLTSEQRQKMKLMREMRAQHREHRKHLRHERWDLRRHGHSEGAVGNDQEK